MTLGNMAETSFYLNKSNTSLSNLLELPKGVTLSAKTSSSSPRGVIVSAMTSPSPSLPVSEDSLSAIKVSGLNWHPEMAIQFAPDLTSFS